MKRLILFAFIMAALSATARERSIEEMRQAASVALQAKSNRAQVKSDALQVVFQEDMLTVLCDGAHFAVIANDDSFEGIVGYADGTFSKDNSSLVWFLETASKSMQEALATHSIHHRALIVPDANLFKSSIAPLLSTTWSQGTPYNNMCPTATDGNAYPSGCVATAVSQIMKYHAYPEHGIGSHQYAFVPSSGDGRIISANFGETTYEWDKMLNNYQSGGYTDEQANAVATIMLHCGISVDMQYTATGSGAYSSEARNGLVKYFGYNTNIGIVYRDYYSLEQWMNMIYAELNKQRPIYYAGADASRGGHAFVIDGYDATGLVHVNWGWGPDGGNGYFDITLLNPTGYQFSSSQDMLLGIDLPTADVTYESHLVSDFALTVTKIGSLLNVSVGQTIWNLNGDVWEGELAVILEGEGETYELSRGTVSKTANLYNVLTNISPSIDGMLKLPTGIADGNYRIFVGAKNSRDGRWQLVRRSGEQTNSYQITIANSKVSTLTSDTKDTWRDTTTGIATLKNSVQHSTRYYDLQGREVSGPAKGLVIRKEGNEVRKVMMK